jgi:hypothetical protein
MTQRDETQSADTYRRVRVRIRRVTVAAALAATGATALVGVVVATDHPGSASPSPSRTPDSSGAPGTHASNGGAPTPTKSAPVVTSGGTSR